MDNPHAFPLDNDFTSQSGMTLRDYFAGQALAGACADPSATESMTYERIAEWCYNQADAMLAARAQE